MDQIDSRRETIIYDLLERLHPLLFWLENFFESDCNLVGLKARLCPPYARLKEHSQMLTRGTVVLNKIPNPCELHLSMLRNLPSVSTDVATDAAYVFSLANAVAKRNTRSARK